MIMSSYSHNFLINLLIFGFLLFYKVSSVYHYTKYANLLYYLHSIRIQLWLGLIHKCLMDQLTQHFTFKRIKFLLTLFEGLDNTDKLI